MLSIKYRLDPKRIPVVARKGKKIYGKHHLIKFLPNPELSEPKFAIIVSKKVDKRAVVRNKIKRRVREQLHKQIPEGKFENGEYLVLVNSTQILDSEHSPFY